MIPSIVSLKILSGSRFRLRLWLPLFLLWPFAAILFLLAMPFLLIANAVISARGIKVRLFQIIKTLWALLSSLCGTTVRVDSRKKNTAVYIKIV